MVESFMNIRDYYFGTKLLCAILHLFTLLYYHLGYSHLSQLKTMVSDLRELQVLYILPSYTITLNNKNPSWPMPSLKKYLFYLSILSYSQFSKTYHWFLSLHTFISFVSFIGIP